MFKEEGVGGEHFGKVLTLPEKELNSELDLYRDLCFYLCLCFIFYFYLYI